jgi:hypothetical protein
MAVGKEEQTKPKTTEKKKTIEVRSGINQIMYKTNIEK